MEIAQRLREARTDSGLTQEQVAEKIMVSRVTLSHWENGKTFPDIASLLSLSELYGISLDELVKGDSNMAEKVKQDSRKAKANERLIGLTAIIMTIVLVIYAVSIFVGGDFRDFCDNAVIWVLVGIGVAAYFAYYGQNETGTKNKGDSHENGKK